jgi:hypothetical protein
VDLCAALSDVLTPTMGNIVHYCSQHIPVFWILDFVRYVPVRVRTSTNEYTWHERCAARTLNSRTHARCGTNTY